ncbi:GTP cyclohydrolase II [Mariniflexile ostreae]|uniref:GTP cyclohydrolase-2 n=1 Tax=Mariniflexile ostreae TaxID=1520892 RepID=A0ABV5F821_9FLAO
MTIKDIPIIQGESVKLPTKYGHFDIIPFQEEQSGIEHMALIKGDLSSQTNTLTRIHSACATGDLFGSLKCDCGDQLIQAMSLIETKGHGLIVYLQQEGRGIGLMNKIKAYKLQEQGMDTIEANVHLGFLPDNRDYQVGANILNALGVNKIELLTNNPDKILGLEKNGIKVVKRVSLIIAPNPFNKHYLSTKETRMGHLINDKEIIKTGL